jgi:peptidoglycan/LPS O-acetylase OafA/YrhL
LYPAYWTCVTLTAIFIIFKTHFYVTGNSDIAQNLPVKYLVNMTMLQYYFRIPDLDGPYWTLIIELSFYGVMLFLMLIKKVKYVEKIGFAAAFLCSLYSLNVIGTNYYFKLLLQGFPLISSFPLFYAGMVLYKMKFEQITPWRLFAFVFTLIAQYLMFNHCYHNVGFVTFTEYTIVLAIIYFTFFLFLIDKLGFIVNPVTKWLGQISYSLYLIHNYLSASILIPGAMKFLHFNFWVAAALALTVVLLLATAINRMIEKPAMNYLRKKYN